MYRRSVVQLILRTSLHLSASGLPERQRQLLQSLTKRPLNQEENKALNLIRKLRRKLLQNSGTIETVDFGAGSISDDEHHPDGGTIRVRSIAELASKVAIPDAWGAFLFKLVHDFGYTRILELGTSIGLSTSYLAIALELNGAGNSSMTRLVTLEGDPATASLARAHLAQISGIPVQVIVGRFEDTLDQVLDASGPFDFIFLDGHHQHKAVVANYDKIRGKIAPGGAVLIDDLEPWETKVRSAWAEIKDKYPETPAVDMFRMGLLFHP